MATNNAKNNLPWKLIQSQTASNVASLNFTTGITSVYSVYVIILDGLIPITTAQDLQMQVSTNGGSTYINTGYQSGTIRASYNSTTLVNAANITTSVNLTGGVNSAGVGASGTIFCYNLNNGNTNAFMGMVSWQGATFIGVGWSGATGPGTTTVNAMQFTFTSGNIASGTVSLYGLQ